MKLFLSFIATLLFLTGCATTEGPNQTNIPPSGTPSPLNTSANPWTNVNPSQQAVMHQ